MSEKPARVPFQWLRNILTVSRAIFWLLLLALVFQLLWGPYRTGSARATTLERLQQERNSRVIAMIHREESVTAFGVALRRSISIEDSEEILRAIRLTPPEQPIDLILHTPGGMVLAAEQIARALLQRRGPVTVFVPHYAMSGGTLIALAADKIVMDPNAVLGPVDPQIGGMPAASILKAVAVKTPGKVKDETLILADIAAKARTQVAGFLTEILLKHHPKDKAAALGALLSEGRWTHDYPITVQTARELGLPVSTDLPPMVHELMDLYPQGRAGKPSVLYVPFSPQPVAPAPPTRSSPATNRQRATD
jgi:ClpP class serine protease